MPGYEVGFLANLVPCMYVRYVWVHERSRTGGTIIWAYQPPSVLRFVHNGLDLLRLFIFLIFYIDVLFKFAM